MATSLGKKMFQSDLVARNVDMIIIQNKVIYAWNTSVSEQRNNNFEKKPFDFSLTWQFKCIIMTDFFYFLRSLNEVGFISPRETKKDFCKIHEFNFVSIPAHLLFNKSMYIESRLNKSHHMLIFFFFWKK